MSESEAQKRPTPGEVYWNSEDEDTEIAEIFTDNDDGSFNVADEDGEEAKIKWNPGNERWEVDE